MQNLNIPSPCYVLDKKLWNKNVAVFKEFQKQSGAWALCALKGFSFYHVFKELSHHITGATTSSLNEILLADVFFDEIHACAPVYLSQEFNRVAEKCSHITFNSLSQFTRFKKELNDHNKPLLRVNPEYSEVQTNLYNPCRTDGRLGVTKKELIEAGGLPKEIVGLHIHALCENDSFVFERLFEQIELRFSEELYKVKYLNLGGGHLITSQGYDLAHFIHQIKNISEKYNVQIIIEPGSAFGWQCGYLKSTVQDIIQKDDVLILMLDVSFAAHMPDCLEMPYQPTVKGFSKNKGQYKIKFGGNTCLAGDEMGGYYSDDPPKVGQEIIFDDMIHYTMVKTTTFNGVNLPSIGLIDEDGEFKLLKQPGFETYQARL